MYGHDANLVPIIPVADASPTGFVPGAPVTFSGGFAEAEYWFYPWLIGLMRYDAVDSPTDFLNGASLHNTRNRFSPGVQFLVRANIKVAFEYEHRWQRPAGESGRSFRPNGFVTGIDYNF